MKNDILVDEIPGDKVKVTNKGRGTIYVGPAGGRSKAVLKIGPGESADIPWSVWERYKHGMLLAVSEKDDEK